MPYVTIFVKTIFRQWYVHACERVAGAYLRYALPHKAGGVPGGETPPLGVLGAWALGFSLAFLLACDGAVEELEVVLVGVT